MRLLCACSVAVEQVLVLVRRDPAALEPEPPSQRDVHGLAAGGPVERRRHVGPPVDDDRVALVVVHVAAADVEPLVAVLAGPGQVEPAEEQRRLGVVGEGLHPLVQRGREVRLRDGVTAAGVQREGGVAHRGQVGAGGGEVGLLGGQRGVGGGGGGGRGGGLRLGGMSCGHAAARLSSRRQRAAAAEVVARLVVERGRSSVLLTPAADERPVLRPALARRRGCRSERLRKREVARRP